MPFYDYIYGTTDKSTDSLYETSLNRDEESPDVVYLTHLTTPESIYHLRIGFASLASKPFKSYLWMWPFSYLTRFFTRFYDHPFVTERNTFHNLNLHTWVLPRFSHQVRQGVDSLIEEALLKADKQGVKVVSLGLLNQGEEMNRNGEMYIERHPKLRVKLVDGSSLAAAIVLNSIPKGTKQVLIMGSNVTKLSAAVVSSLCKMGIKVISPIHLQLAQWAICFPFIFYMHSLCQINNVVR